jgi:hypothetical protein
LAPATRGQLQQTTRTAKPGSQPAFLGGSLSLTGLAPLFAGALGRERTYLGLEEADSQFQVRDPTGKLFFTGCWLGEGW